MRKQKNEDDKKCIGIGLFYGHRFNLVDGRLFCDRCGLVVKE